MIFFYFMGENEQMMDWQDLCYFLVLVLMGLFLGVVWFLYVEYVIVVCCVVVFEEVLGFWFVDR